MSTKKIRWLLGALNIPGVGETEIGVVYPKPLPVDMADSLIRSGIAEEVLPKSKNKLKSKGGDKK